MARGNELLDSLREEVALTREEVARSREESATTRDAYERQIQITRKALRRNELVFQGATRELSGVREEPSGLREDSRTQTEAIFALIDELRGGRPRPAPA